MRKNRRDSLKKERIIMITSSAFVLAALTMTGLYMKGQEAKEHNDGYTLDFTALENSADKKMQEIQNNGQSHIGQDAALPGGTNMENDLDYMPAEEAGSNLVEIPGLTDQNKQKDKTTVGGGSQSKENGRDQEKKSDESDAAKTKDMTEVSQNAENLDAEETAMLAPEQEVPARELHFSENERMIRPVSGDVILPYSMSGSIYFQTLAQYKYNPATVYEAQEGTAVTACAEGRILNIFDDAEIGRAVAMDLGDGYTVTYGQLSDIPVGVGDYVDAGQVIGVVATPTKYYSLEGPNLYFKLEKDGEPLNPANRY